MDGSLSSSFAFSSFVLDFSGLSRTRTTTRRRTKSGSGSASDRSWSGGCLLWFFLGLGRRFGLFRRLGFNYRFGFFRRFAFLGLDGSNGHIDPFKDSEMPGIALALAQFHNPCITAMALLLERSDFVEEDADHVLLVQSCSSHAAVMQSALFAQGDHLFGHRARCFGLGQSGGDPFMFDEAANQVGKHRVAMLAGAAQLGGSL